MMNKMLVYSSSCWYEISNPCFFFFFCVYHIMFIHSSHNGRVSYFHLWAVVKSAATNSCIQVSKSPFSIFLCEIGGPSGYSMVNFLRNRQTFLQRLYYFTYQWCTRVSFLHIFANAFASFLNNHHGGCEVVSHCVLHWHFPGSNGAEYYFMYSPAICIASSDKWPKSFTHF